MRFKTNQFTLNLHAYANTVAITLQIRDCARSLKKKRDLGREGKDEVQETDERTDEDVKTDECTNSR